MHNCKSARDGFIDLALNEIPPGRSRQLLAELGDCRECHEEYAALRSTLHISAQALRSASPGENFWPGYRDRLRHALVVSAVNENVSGASFGKREGTSGRHWSAIWPALKASLTTSVRVPLPAALALMFMFVISVVALGLLSKEGAIPATPITTVETKTVLVPIIQEKLQEKIVTRIVYAERKSNRRRQSDRTLTGIDNTLAGAASEASRKTALNLVGFVPTDEVKLTIIKGSDPK